jgi:hypothetical protein
MSGIMKPTVNSEMQQSFLIFIRASIRIYKSHGEGVKWMVKLGTGQACYFSPCSPHITLGFNQAEQGEDKKGMKIEN